MKNTKNLLLLGVMAAAMASCSSDEPAMEKAANDGSSVKFAVTTQGVTRAADVFCNANMPGQFSVYAVSGGKTFINGDVISNTGGSGSAAVWENQTAKRYWPGDSTVNFFAQVNGDDVFSLNAGEPTFDDFQVNSDVASQTDLLYAVKTGQKKTTNGGTVALNFHHALSQVVFYAKNVNPDIYVEVTGISVCGVNDKGTYTFPETDTDANVDHGTPTGTPNGGQGTWAFDETSKGSYNVTFPAVALKGDSLAVASNLTDNTNTTEGYGHGDGANDFSKAMILMPQGAFTGPAIKEGTGNIVESALDGVYFKVTCKIYNVADKTAADLTDNVMLWDGTKDIYIPVSGTWNEGMKYVYTIIFGNGDGGWDPDGPKPVLVPITYTVSVDEFIPVTGGDQDVEMNTNK